MSALDYEEKKGKTQYGDYIEVEGKPENEQLREYVHLLTDQMLSLLESQKIELHGNPVTWIIKEPNKLMPGSKWTIGWKIVV